MTKGDKHRPESILKMIETRGGGPEKRFWRKVNKATLTGCWEWIGGLNETGHPRFWIDRKLVGAHRYSYETQVGAIPDGMVVCHACDNPKCVRPEHLFVGTNQDNSTDAKLKGRISKDTGKRIDERTKELIRSLRAAGMSRIAICKELNVSPKTVQKYGKAS